MKFEKKIIYLLIFVFVIIIIAGIFILLKNNSDIFNKGETTKTEVKIVNNFPRILVNGEDKIKAINEIYYVPTETNNYSEGGWLTGVKEQIDEMQNYGANTLVLAHSLWWSELEEKKGSIDFDPLDEAMEYAKQKGIYIVLGSKVDAFPPSWWAKENNFPTNTPWGFEPCIPQEVGTDQACIPKEICAMGDARCCTTPKENLYCCILNRADNDHGFGTNFASSGLPRCNPIKNNQKYKTCIDCETDSYGWKYGNSGYGSAKFRDDYGAFLKKLISRYKNYPALVGWFLMLGPSGEDSYGPSYIALRNIYGNTQGEGKRDQIADYSENAQKLFKEWIKTKYSSNSEIQASWNDPETNLDTVKLPDPKKIFINNNTKFFPDDIFLHTFVELEDLTPIGRDLYDFREAVRNVDRNYFTKLIKENDPNHILIYNGGSNDAIYANPYIDALLANNHIEYAQTSFDEANTIALLTARAIKYGKVPLYALESVGSTTGLSKTLNKEKQKEALLLAGQTIICNGGYFGYASEIPSLNMDMPSWFSVEDKEALVEISKYSPTENCVCELTPVDGLVALQHSISEMAEILDLDAFFECVSLNTSRCGDGFCDNFEQSSGMCLQDCK